MRYLLEVGAVCGNGVDIGLLADEAHREQDAGAVGRPDPVVDVAVESVADDGSGIASVVTSWSSPSVVAVRIELPSGAQSQPSATSSSRATGSPPSEAMTMSVLPSPSGFSRTNASCEPSGE